MLLVVDVTKGIQTQTAECLIIGEITCDKMIVVLNKVDLIEPTKRASAVNRVSTYLQILTSLNFKKVNSHLYLSTYDVGINCLISAYCS